MAAPDSFNADQLRARVNAIRWYHSIDLGQGIVTPGVDDSRYRLPRLHLPESLAGKSVLDIGAWDGFFSFEAERRGAARVLATDSYSWSGLGWGRKDGFELARAVLGSKIEDLNIDPFDLTVERVGQFDLTFFLGVLYHVRHPLLVLEKVAAVTRERLILDTVVDLLGVGRPAMAFYQGTELNNDPTNWWAPNIEGMKAMLQAVGFARVEVMTPVRSAPYRFLRAGYHQVKGKNAFHLAYRQDRAVFHAYK